MGILCCAASEQSEPLLTEHSETSDTSPIQNILMFKHMLYRSVLGHFSSKIDCD